MQKMYLRASNVSGEKNEKYPVTVLWKFDFFFVFSAHTSSSSTTAEPRFYDMARRKQNHTVKSELVFVKLFGM